MSNDEKIVKGAGRLGTRIPEEGGRQNPEKEDWIGRQLRRVFDEALNEPLPDDIMSLLARIDDEAAEPNEPRKSEA